MNPTFSLALAAWQSAADLRQRRQRYKRYTYGRQWDDPVVTPGGITITEHAEATNEGQRPMTNNVIRQLVKCVVGNFRSAIASDDPARSAALAPEIEARNSLTELDSRALEEFLISGCAIQRVVDEKRLAGSGVWVDNVSPDNFFVNKFADPRGLDIELIGMLHSMSLREVIMRYGNRTPKSMERIHRAYSGELQATIEGYGIFRNVDADISSNFFCDPLGRCRVIEVWTLESRNMLRCVDRHDCSVFLTDASSSHDIKRLNRRRAHAGMDGVDTTAVTSLRWHCRIFTPLGQLIDEYDSPYAHGLHPFVVKFYPMIDGEVHSLVEDIIDQQRYINRLITLIDHVMSVSAKGVLLYPMEAKPDEMSWGEIAQNWAKCGGILPIEPGAGDAIPRQLISGTECGGAYHMLNTQLTLFQQISGVNDALQGRLPQSQTSAALYDSQLRSSATALLDLLDSFNTFRQSRNHTIKSL